MPDLTPNGNCCHIGPADLRCEDKAEWVIYERCTTIPQDHATFTFSCTRHVGQMLTSAGDPLPGQRPHFVLEPLP